MTGWYLKKFVVTCLICLNFSSSESQRQSCNKLLTLIDVINETVGDAIADMLLVETILHAKGWDIQDWEQCYTDLPNRLVKVKVKVCISLLFTFCFHFLFAPVCQLCFSNSTLATTARYLEHY